MKPIIQSLGCGESFIAAKLIPAFILGNISHLGQYHNSLLHKDLRKTHCGIPHTQNVENQIVCRTSLWIVNDQRVRMIATIPGALWSFRDHRYRTLSGVAPGVPTSTAEEAAVLGGAVPWGLAWFCA
jgi:hypothetical protein